MGWIARPALHRLTMALVVLLALRGGGIAAAAAETVKALRAAKLHERDGESSKVVAEVAEGETLAVLGRSGRWLKVKTSGKPSIVGWITRSNVDDGAIPRNTRRRPSVDRGAAGWSQRYERVAGDTVPEDQRREAPRRGTETSDDRRDDHRDAALSLEECRDDAESIEEYDDCGSRTERPPRTSQQPRKGLTLQAHAGLGFSSISAAFSSNGTGDLAAYKLGSSAVALGAGGSALYALGPKTAIGARLTYELARSAPGVRYSDGTTSVNIPFSIHRLTAGVVAETDAGKVVIGGLLGLRFEKFVVSDVEDLTKNLARLPTEVFNAAAIGAYAAFPRLTDKIGADVAMSVLLAGKRTQTAGLEDGVFDKASGVSGALRGTYHLTKFSIYGVYEFDRRKTTWQGAAAGSMRGHDATQAQRSDTWHTLTVGLVAQF